jgi:hypothetical protein
MGQILGLGITHYPNLSYKGNMSRRILQCLEDPALAERYRSVDDWHPTMREQWGSDQGQAHSDRHRQDLITQFRKIRAELDADATVGEIPVQHSPRRFGCSRYGWSRSLSGMFDLITLLMLGRYTHKPLHFFGLLGVVCASIGGLITLVLGIGWLQGYWLTNRPLFLVGIFFLLSASMRRWSRSACLLAFPFPSVCACPAGQPMKLP